MGGLKEKKSLINSYSMTYQHTYPDSKHSSFVICNYFYIFIVYKIHDAI